MADFVPTSNDALVTWLVNLRTKIALYAAQLGLTAAQVTAMQALCDQLVTAIQLVDQKKADLAAVIAARTTLAGTTIPALRLAAAQWRKLPAVTPAIIAELKIASTTTPFDPDAFKATLTADVFPGFVRFKFVKDQTDGILLNCRLKGQMAWNFVSRDTNSPYEDHTPVATPGVAEQREYQAQGILNDAPIGQPSDIVSVTVAG